MIELTPFLKSLLSLPGLSGNEAPIREVIAEAWRPLTDEISVSPVGSLHAVRYGEGTKPRRRIMLAAHMDALGMMVTGIVNGFLRITEIGGIDPRILPGTPVMVHGRQDLPGIVVQIPDRLIPSSQAGKPAGFEYLLVDTGLHSEEVKRLVRLGDLISFNTKPVELAGGAVAGHSQDNRASVAAVTMCLQNLQRMAPQWDTWAVATVQEEETLAGALTSPFAIRPDIAIAVDVTFAKGPGVSDYRGFEMDKGPTLGIGPDMHPALYKAFKDLAEELDFPYHNEVMPSHSGTDAYGMQVVAEGIPCMVIGIPLRYMHTPVEEVVVKDIARTGMLLSEFIARLTPDFMDKVR
ncbi:MAG: M42 family metallopeptidase, partial [Anaerolineaceae bacterium]|nr:M42 family metallopeptidase [Anaerolineaceae bacterium]